MQNAQVLADTGGCSKCVLKHCAKIDEQNYCVVEVNGSGKMVTKSTFLHNTKVTSSKMGKDKDCENNKKKPNGSVVSPLQVHYHIRVGPSLRVPYGIRYDIVSTSPGWADVVPEWLVSHI